MVTVQFGDILQLETAFRAGVLFKFSGDLDADVFLGSPVMADALSQMLGAIQVYWLAAGIPRLTPAGRFPNARWMAPTWRWRMAFAKRVSKDFGGTIPAANSGDSESVCAACSPTTYVNPLSALLSTYIAIGCQVSPSQGRHLGSLIGRSKSDRELYGICVDMRRYESGVDGKKALIHVETHAR